MFDTDIIAVLPIENDALVENTKRLVKEYGLTLQYILRHLARGGTQAAKMPQVPRECARKVLIFYVLLAKGRRSAL